MGLTSGGAAIVRCARLRRLRLVFGRRPPGHERRWVRAWCWLRAACASPPRTWSRPRSRQRQRPRDPERVRICRWVDDVCVSGWIYQSGWNWTSVAFGRRQGTEQIQQDAERSRRQTTPTTHAHSLKHRLPLSHHYKNRPLARWPLAPHTPCRTIHFKTQN